MSTPAENPHALLLQQQLPRWTVHNHEQHWRALHDSLLPAQGLPASQAAWFTEASPERRQALLDSQARLTRSQHAQAQALAGLRQINEYCEPLLQAQLARLGITAPVRSTDLLRVSRAWSWLGTCFLNSSERHSLLQAALLNFAPEVSFDTHSALAPAATLQIRKELVQGFAPLGYDLPATRYQLPSESYQLDALPLTPARFAQACRELDLGQRYQMHLCEVFDGSPGAQRRELGMQVQRDSLRLATELAYLQQVLGQASHAQLTRLLGGERQTCWTLTMFDIPLHEVLLIDAHDAGVLLYLPGNAGMLQPCKDLDAVQQTLAAHLQDGQRRQAFLAYVPLEHKAHWLDLLQQNLPAAGGDDLQLHLQQTQIDGELFGYLQDRHVARLKAEARLLAVPTADADEQARKQRLEDWENIGLNALTLAGFFIPAVGTLMLGVTACQLLYEVYEGYQTWQVGDRHEAFAHLKAVGVNLAVMAGLHVGGKALGKLLGSPLMEKLERVETDGAGQRLWQPDLTPYRSETNLPEDLQANAQGQYEHAGQHFIKLDGQLYRQRLDPRLQRWRIVHPQQQDAYQPLLEHNGEGAWRVEHERPQDWSMAQLVRRLGPVSDGLDEHDLRLAANLCGVSEDALRSVHLNNQPAPALLLDTLARLRAQRQVLAAMRNDATLQQEQLFAQLYNPPAPAAPLAEALQQAHPELDLPLCRRLLARLTPEERELAERSAELPPWLHQAVAQVQQQLPLTRALEGLYLTHLAPASTERLLLAGLQRLPGWSAQLRVEIRAGGPQGPLLQAIGPGDSAQRCIVIRSAAGYEAYLGERPAPGKVDSDLCRAVLQALPATQRSALGLAESGADGLREQLLHASLGERPALLRRLWGSPTQAWRSAGLRGGDSTGVYPTRTWRTSWRHRYQQVYPSASDEQFTAQLARWRREARAPEIELTRLQERLQHLRGDLRDWAAASARRQRAVNPIVAAWRRNSLRRINPENHVHSLDLGNLGLDNDDIASLPLPDDFAHIEELELSNDRQPAPLHPEQAQPERRLSQLPPAFLSRFPRLQRLYLRGNRLAAMPQVVAPLRLLSLDLQGNRITWDERAQTQLNRAANLQHLDLSDNPLLTAPRLGALRDLQILSLENAHLTHLPEGLEQLPPLNPNMGPDSLPVLDLTGNQFEALPVGVVFPDHIARAMDLESDWLSPLARAQIDAYSQEHGVDLLVGEHQYEELLAQATPAQRALWYRLPVNYRRGLRELLEQDTWHDDPEAMREEAWQQLQHIDENPLARAYALSQPALALLDLQWPPGAVD